MYDQMCEINLLKVFNNIHQLALLQDSRVFRRLDLSLPSGGEVKWGPKSAGPVRAGFSLRNTVLSFSTSNSEVENEKN